MNRIVLQSTHLGKKMNDLLRKVIAIRSLYVLESSRATRDLALF